MSSGPAESALEQWSRWAAFGLRLFVAGGVSNWVDRAVRGSVVDFMNVGLGPVRTGVFNVADVAIMLGVTIFILTELRRAPDALISASARHTRLHETAGGEAEVRQRDRADS